MDQQVLNQLSSRIKLAALLCTDNKECGHRRTCYSLCLNRPDNYINIGIAMGCCVSRRSSYNTSQEKNTSNKQHNRDGQSLTVTRGGATRQSSVEEAIDRNEITKDSIENDLEKLQQQLEECR